MARLFDASTGARPTGWAFTRSGSTATYINASNVLTTAAANVQRVEYDNSGVLLGLLYEPSQSNLLLQSQTFANAAWLTINGAAKVGAASGVVGPDGTTGDAYEVSFGATGGAIGSASAVYQQSITMSASTRYGGYYWVRAKTGSTTIRVSITDQNSVTTGTADQTVTATAWTRVFLSVVTSSTGATGGNLAIRNNVAGNSANVYIWAADISQVPNDYPASYVPTTTASASHSADSASFTLGSVATGLIFTFDDGSTQAVTVTPGGGTYTIPTNLSRSHILYIDDNVIALVNGNNTIPTGSYICVLPAAGAVTMNARGSGAGGAKQAAGGGGAADALSTAKAVASTDKIYASIPAGPAGVSTLTGTAGSVAWININTNSAPTSATTGVKAAGGSANSGTTGGIGGLAANSIGDTINPGGNGALAGGGGSAGTTGAGGNASGSTGGAAGAGGGSVGGAGSATAGATAGSGTNGSGAGSSTSSTGSGGDGGDGAGLIVFIPYQTYGLINARQTYLRR